MKQCSGIDVHFTGWEPVRIADLVAAERNNRRHGDEQVALVEAVEAESNGSARYIGIRLDIKR